MEKECCSNTSLIVSPDGEWSTAQKAWWTPSSPCIQQCIDDLIWHRPLHPCNLSLAVIGDSHAREMTISFCEARDGLLEHLCKNQSTENGMCDMALRCSAYGVKVGYYFHASLDNPVFVDSKWALTTIEFLARWLGRTPDAIVLNGGAWDILEAAKGKSNLTRHVFGASERAYRELQSSKVEGHRFPLDLASEFAAAWEQNLTRYVVAIRRGASLVAGRRKQPLPALVWLTLHRTMPQQALLGVGQGELQDNSRTTGLVHWKRCYNCVSYSEVAPSLEMHQKNKALPVCCVPLWGEIVEALNAAAHRQTHHAGGIIIDAWRMTEGIPTMSLLWDGFHMRHRYSAVLMNLAVNAVRALKHDDQRTKSSVSGRSWNSWRLT